MTTQDDISKAQLLFSSGLGVTDDFSQTTLAAAIVAAIDNNTAAIREQTEAIESLNNLLDVRLRKLA